MLYIILYRQHPTLFFKENKKMKNRIILILAASLLVVALAFGVFQSAYAQGGPGGYDPFQCQLGLYCYWEAHVCNDQTGFYEDIGVPFDPNSFPVSVEEYLGVVLGVDYSNCAPGWDGMKEAGKCKLTEIDEKIYLGTPFEAKWIGRGGHLRFIKPSGDFNYIAKVEVSSGTVMQDGNEYVGMFSARGVVEPGVYTVQCFGPGGTAGLGIKNVEIVGH
jgi:hypothetical protein